MTPEQVIRAKMALGDLKAVDEAYARFKERGYCTAQSTSTDPYSRTPADFLGVTVGEVHFALEGDDFDLFCNMVRKMLKGRRNDLRKELKELGVKLP
jgi:hypothetical protein